MRKNSQHRPERESPIRERNDLRSQNRTLKRQVSRLKKQLKEYENAEALQAEPEEALPPLPEVAEEVCPKCGSTDLGTYTLSIGSKKTVVGCRTCRRWHKTVA